jgi:hypothetical protein
VAVTEERQGGDCHIMMQKRRMQRRMCTETGDMGEATDRKNRRSYTASPDASAARPI